MVTTRRIGVVAWHVFKECVRDRVLYGIGAVAVFLVAASFVIGQITAGQDVKIIKDLGLATIEAAGVMMAVFIGVGLVAREMERRSIYSVLAKPLPRWEFIVGKYAGLLLTIVVNIVMMTVALYVLLLWMGWMAPENVRRAWDAPAADPHLLVAMALIVAELALLTAIALFFSTFSSSGLWSVVLTVGLLVAGLESRDLRHFSDLVDTPVLGRVVEAIGWLVPAFSAFDVKADVVHGRSVPWGFVGLRLAYAAVYATVVIGASVAVFSRREFK